MGIFKLKSKKSEQDKKPNMDCINLLTSILVSYPEISVISFEPNNEEIHIKYTLNKPLNDDERRQAREFLMDSLMTYQYLENVTAQVNEVDLEIQEKMTLIDVKRDVKSFLHGEIKLFSQLLQEKFLDCLMIDGMSEDKNRVPLLDPLTMAQTELIDRMLSSLKINPVCEEMVGIREDGRVIVFNR